MVIKVKGGIKMDLENLIMYEHENTSLDFKSIQYEREHYEAMIKDVMSMANADVDEDRYIITGIKDKPSGERNTLGIEGKFEDSATYQQLIFQNIEPQINIDYFSYTYDSKILGIIRIYNCNNQPYMMRKDYKKLQRGEAFIRIGSHQTRMVLSDYERIYDKRKSEDNFINKVKLGFNDQDFAKEVELNLIKKSQLPSKRAKEEILKVKILDHPIIYPVKSYEQSSIEKLEKSLYEIFEQGSHKLNIYILNQGNRYIEDSSIEVKIEKIDGLLIASRIYEKSPAIIFPDKLPLVKKYPNVKQEGSVYIISQQMGDIKHNITTKAFPNSLRIVLTEKAKNQTIKLTCKIFGKNLTEPLEEELRIKVIDILGQQQEN